MMRFLLLLTALLSAVAQASTTFSGEGHVAGANVEMRLDIDQEGKTDGHYSESHPLADQKVTCEEMEQLPSLVFDLEDLGSGYGSPTEVDYQCPKSLGQLDILGALVEQASHIRAPAALPQICTGSIVHAQWRYYQFDLARLGYYPQGYSPRERKNRRMEYFREWSYRSLYNRKVYDAYMEALGEARPLLIEWYRTHHSVDRKTARDYAQKALKRISGYGFGSYSSRWQPESLVPHTDDAIEGRHEAFLESFDAASDEAKKNSLRRLLVRKADTSIIDNLVGSIKDTTTEKGTESLLSSAVRDADSVELLLTSGFEPGHPNEFGKTALFYAIQFNEHESAARLLDQGARVNHSYQPEDDLVERCSGIERWGRTPLMHAAQHADTKMLDRLLQHGATLHAEDVKGDSALDYAIRGDKEDNARFLRLQAEEGTVGASSVQNGGASGRSFEPFGVIGFTKTTCR